MEAQNSPTSDSSSRLAACPDCTQAVSHRAEVCPHCGRRLRLSRTDIMTSVLLVALVIVAILLGFVVWFLNYYIGF